MYPSPRRSELANGPPGEASLRATRSGMWGSPNASFTHRAARMHERVSMEEEHRRILREALLGNAAKRPSFKEALLAMPNVGDEKDFKRGPQIGRPVKL